MYILGMAVAVLSGILLSKTVFRGVFSPFVLELPQYHMPSFRAIMLRTWEKSKGFVIKAGTIIFAMSVVVWFFQNFDISFQMVSNSGDSMLGQLGKWMAGLFAPLGFGTWQAAVSILTGLVAKESVVSTMNVLYADGGSISAALSQVFTPLSAYAFMAFTLLYMPCISAFATIRREMNSMKWAVATALYQTGVAYLVSLLIFQVGSLVAGLL
jgi:ferrous iron transport protein B